MDSAVSGRLARLQAARDAAAQSLFALDAATAHNAARSASSLSGESSRYSTPEPRAAAAAGWSRGVSFAGNKGASSPAPPRPPSDGDAAGLVGGVLRPRGGGGGAVLSARGSENYPSSGRATPFSTLSRPSSSLSQAPQAQQLTLPRVRLNSRGSEVGGDASGAATSPFAQPPPAAAPSRPSAHELLRPTQALQRAATEEPVLRSESRRAAAAAAASAADAEAAAAAAADTASRALALERAFLAQRRALEEAVRGAQSEKERCVSLLERQLGDLTKKVAEDLVAAQQRTGDKERARDRVAAQLSATQSAAESRIAQLTAALEACKSERGLNADALQTLRDALRKAESAAAVAHAHAEAAEERAAHCQSAAAAQAQADAHRAAMTAQHAAAAAAARAETAAAQAVSRAEHSAAAANAKLDATRGELQTLREQSQRAAVAAETRGQLLRAAVAAATEQCAAVEAAASAQADAQQADVQCEREAHQRRVAALESQLADAERRCGDAEAPSRRCAALERALCEQGERFAATETAWAQQKRAFLAEAASERSSTQAELARATAALEACLEERAQAHAHAAGELARRAADCDSLRAALDCSRAEAASLTSELLAQREAAQRATSELRAKISSLAASAAAAEGAGAAWAAERNRLGAEAADARRAGAEALSTERMAATEIAACLAGERKRADAAEQALAEAQRTAAADALRASKRFQAKEGERAALASLLAEAMDWRQTGGAGAHLPPPSEVDLSDRGDDDVAEVPESLGPGEDARLQARAAAEARARAAAAAEARGRAAGAEVAAWAAARVGALAASEEQGEAP